MTATTDASNLEFTQAKAADRPIAREHGEEVNRMTKLYFWALARREEGQTMAEYGVVLAVITVAIVGVLGILSGKIQTAITAVSNAI